MRKIAVGDIMTRSFVAVKPDTNLLDCAKEMVKKRVGSLLIANSRRLVGIITDKDILWTITKKPSINLKEVKAADVAARKVAVIKPSADISQAFKKMKKLNFRRLPVLSKGELVGMITLKDILKIDPTFYSNTGELQQIREETQKLNQLKRNWPEEGFCDRCGNFNELLKVYDKLLCPDCREELY